MMSKLLFFSALANSLSIAVIPGETENTGLCSYYKGQDLNFESNDLKEYPEMVYSAQNCAYHCAHSYEETGDQCLGWTWSGTTTNRCLFKSKRYGAREDVEGVYSGFPCAMGQYGSVDKNNNVIFGMRDYGDQIFDNGDPRTRYYFGPKGGKCEAGRRLTHITQCFEAMDLLGLPNSLGVLNEPFFIPPPAQAPVDACFDVHVGPTWPSAGHSKTVTVAILDPTNPENGPVTSCDATPKNWQAPHWVDQFSAEVSHDGRTVTVTRTDAASPWGQDLVISCCRSVEAEDAPTGCAWALDLNGKNVHWNYEGQGCEELIPICEREPYFIGEKGSFCPRNHQINHVEECRRAHEELGLAMDKEAILDTEEAQFGCSTNQKRRRCKDHVLQQAVGTNNLHFNSNRLGWHARTDLTPVCKSYGLNMQG